jgi:type II secretory pathway pseudopilin PulG
MKFRSGQSLVELLLAVALASVMLPALLTGLVASRQGRVQQEQRVKAVQLLQETQEAMRSIREKGWTYLTTNGTYHPIISGSSWSLASGSDVSGDYTRQIVITDVYRDTTTKQIVTSGGFLDPSTKRADITISWSIPYASSIASTVYLTRYLDNLVYLQTTKADFDSDTLVQLSTTNTSGGEVQISNNTKAKWCLPSFASSSIDLPDGPPVAVSATASAPNNNPELYRISLMS